jgi:hypothetical protein
VVYLVLEFREEKHIFIKVEKGNVDFFLSKNYQPAAAQVSFSNWTSTFSMHGHIYISSLHLSPLADFYKS